MTQDRSTSRSPAPARSASSTSTRIKQHRRRRGRLAGRPRARQDAGGRRASTASAHVTTDLAESLALTDVDAVILCTPTQMHAEQAIACLKAGKHVQVEIPLADTLADAEAVRRRCRSRPGWSRWSATRAASTRATSGCTSKIVAGEFNIQQMDVQTYFFRRTNMNALGQPRSWTDHLLWHHAAHTVDLFAYQTGGQIVDGQRGAGADPSRARHRDGHVDPAEEQHRRDLHAVAVVQQRRAARHVLPLHRRHRHLHRALRRPRSTARKRRSTCRRSTSR